MVFFALLLFFFLPMVFRNEYALLFFSILVFLDEQALSLGFFFSDDIISETSNPKEATPDEYYSNDSDSDTAADN